MNRQIDVAAAPVHGIVHRLRKYAGSLHGPQNDDMRKAADIVELFCNQMQNVDCKMDSQHRWRFRSGWPMNHAIGGTPDDAIESVLREIKRDERERWTCPDCGGTTDKQQGVFGIINQGEGRGR